MNIGIVGLGLIGGSFARVLKQNDNNKIFATDVNRSAYLAACMTGSGSAVFGIFKEKDRAEKTATELCKKFNNVYVCTPEKYGVEIINIEN